MTSLPSQSIDGVLAGGKEGFAPVKDRLTTTLFLAGLFHAMVIIGVNFVGPSGSSPSAAPILDVVVLTNEAPNEQPRPNAEYLAQRNQTGNGNIKNSEQPASPASSPLAAAQDGSSAGNGTEFKQAIKGAPATELLSSRSEHGDISFLAGRIEPSSDSEIPLALTPTPPNPVSTRKIDKELQLRGQNDRELFVTPDTRESRLAPYLDTWRRKIEKIGTLNYPVEAQRWKRAKWPVLEVVIRADGRLMSSAINRSSGDKAVDQAALSILKLAAPFDPFPTALRKEYDQLRFAYEWQFLGGYAGAAEAAGNQ